MKVINVVKSKKKYKVEFENKSIELYPGVFATYNLYINKIIEDKDFKEIKSKNKIEEFYLYALKLLNRQTYSPNKLEEFLYKKGAKKGEIKEVINKLTKYNFLDEEKFVKDIISFCDVKHYGYFKIIKMLNDRKISPKKISKVKYNLSREEKECILLIKKLENKWINKNDFTRKKNIYSSLVRNGFNEAISLELTNKLCNSNHKNEINVLKLDYKKYLKKYSSKYKGIELSSKITNALLAKGYRISDINEVKESYK